MKHNRRRSPGKPRVSPSLLDRINPNAAGLDCGSAEHFVAVPPDRDPSLVQSFTTFTSDLVRLADWLTACPPCRVKSVLAPRSRAQSLAKTYRPASSPALQSP